MRDRFRSTFARALIGLIAAYAVALQTVFTMLAPMPALAANVTDSFAAHCFGNGTAGLAEGGEPGTPLPASGKMHCVFCGACAAGFVTLPSIASETRMPAATPHVFAHAASSSVAVAGHARAGPARAPPQTL